MDAMWFQQALERAGASQADLARHLRLAPSAISRMLKGERQMKLLEAVQVSAFLGVSQEDVLRHAGDTTGAAPRTEPARRGPPPPTGPPLAGPARAEPDPVPRARRGGRGVVDKQGQAVLIKQFVRWDADSVVLRQLNPADELRIPRAEVLECHLVVGVDQEG